MFTALVTRAATQLPCHRSSWVPRVLASALHRSQLSSLSCGCFGASLAAPLTPLPGNVPPYLVGDMRGHTCRLSSTAVAFTLIAVVLVILLNDTRNVMGELQGGTALKPQFYQQEHYLFSSSPAERKQGAIHILANYCRHLITGRVRERTAFFPSGSTTL